ncbi:MAG: hypothetical protein LQ350_007744 [Teloschistes chrysophthalmus]|nr:MAG: hypothetical protein LQ350_007744 [Niorma chrysophthalma]
MSTVTASSSSTTGYIHCPPHRKFTPTSTPISLLPTQNARLYQHIHPTLLLSVFYLRFSAIVADPVSELFKLTFVLMGLQMLYVVLCLPTAKAGVLPKTGTYGPRKPKPGTKRTTQGNGIAGKMVPALLSTLLTLVLATPLLMALIICFGASITTHLAHTSLLATHMALLAFLPLFYVYGVDGKMWREILSASLPWDGVWGGTVGTMVGAWCGAVPIPLDWDREWQKWPVTIITGAYIGWAVGRLAGEFLFKGKRIEFDDYDDLEPQTESEKSGVTRQD